MLKITIVAVGKLKERYWREATSEYLMRLRSYADVRVIEVADEPDSLGEAARQREGEAICKALPAGAKVVLLDVRGTPRSSEDIAAWLEVRMVEGMSHLALVIGGSAGVSLAVRDRAQETLSFGALTLPHNLARVVLVEQLYRAFKIARNEPYHK
jgi:23S rRNA (pseudouridine1915-N3)-methyltransferase